MGFNSNSGTSTAQINGNISAVPPAEYTLTADELINVEKIIDCTNFPTGTYQIAEKIVLGSDWQALRTLRIKFSISNSGANQSWFRIYKNGVAYGTERNIGSAGYVEYSEDLVFSGGDSIEIWCKNGLNGNACAVKNFKINGKFVPSGTKTITTYA